MDLDFVQSVLKVASVVIGSFTIAVTVVGVYALRRLRQQLRAHERDLGMKRWSIRVEGIGQIDMTGISTAAANAKSDHVIGSVVAGPSLSTVNRYVRRSVELESPRIEELAHG